MEDQRELLIVDWSGMAHRSFHALGAGEDMLAQDVVAFAHEMSINVAVNVMLAGARVVFVQDGGLSGRQEIYPEYKNQRVAKADRPMNLTLALGGVSLKEVHRATVIRADGFEADDTMATIAQNWPGRAFILSNDGDLMQTVTERIHIVRPRSQNIQDLIFVDPDFIAEKYGFLPTRIPDYKAIQGDKADNIPKVPGIGHGIACKLIQRYETAEGVIQAAARMDSGLTLGQAEKIIALRDQIRLNLRLTQLVSVPWGARMVEFILRSQPGVV